MLGVLWPTLLSAHWWRPEHDAGGGGGGSSSRGGSSPGSGGGRAAALVCSLRRLPARCNRALHLALYCPSKLQRLLLVWWTAGYVWAACKALEA